MTYRLQDPFEARGRRVAGMRLIQPASVKADGRRIVWVADREGTRTVPVPDDLLELFIDLANSDAEAVAGFAEDFGVLAICSHHLPATHRPFGYPAPAERSPGSKMKAKGIPIYNVIYTCAPTGWDGRGAHESVADWHAFAQEAETIRAVSRRLLDGEPLSDTQRAALADAPLAKDIRPRPTGAIAEDRAYVARIIRAWLTVGDVRPGPVWTGSTVSVELRGHLFGALGLQLMLDAAKLEGLPSCKSCGELFPVRRGEGISGLCPRCRNTKNVRAHRERKRIEAEGEARAKTRQRRTRP